MKRLVIAAAFALGIPAFAAEEADKTPAQPPSAENAAPAKEMPAEQQVAVEGISKDVTLEAAPGANAGETQTLRFESWARDRDEPFETEEQWNARQK